MPILTLQLPGHAVTTIGTLSTSTGPSETCHTRSPSLLPPQEKIRSQQKAAAGANLRLAIDTAVATAAEAAAAGQSACVLRIDVGLDVTAVREAVATVLGQQKVRQSSILMFHHVTPCYLVPRYLLVY